MNKIYITISFIPVVIADIQMKSEIDLEND